MKYPIAITILEPQVPRLIGAYDLTGPPRRGGGTSTGGEYELSGSIGQPDAGTLASPDGTLKLKGGFWPGAPCPFDIPADYDGDCDVDHADYLSWEACASGTDVPYVGDCSDTDFDGDLDTDQGDFAVFQRCTTGEDITGDPNCGG
jgi:hypothetical protein